MFPFIIFILLRYHLICGVVSGCSRRRHCLLPPNRHAFISCLFTFRSFAILLSYSRKLLLSQSVARSTATLLASLTMSNAEDTTKMPCVSVCLLEVSHCNYHFWNFLRSSCPSRLTPKFLHFHGKNYSSKYLDNENRFIRVAVNASQYCEYRNF